MCNTSNPSKFVILADFTCDLSEQIRQEIGMEDYIQGHIHFDDGRDFPTTLDWKHISREAFYKDLSDKRRRISTSPYNIAEYYECFEKYIQSGYGVICICLSSKISSAYGFACSAQRSILEKYPDAAICCVDSLRMSGGLGVLTVYAHILKKEGKSFIEIVQWLEENKSRVHQMGPLDDLFYIARRGNITMGKAIMGSFAGVKPMGDCNADGYTTIIVKVKGINKALDATVQYVAKTAVDIRDQYVIVAHSNREQYANILKEKIETELGPKKVFVTDVFCGCGANIGPGMVGVFYLGEKISEDMVKEKEAMNSIVKK